MPTYDLSTYDSITSSVQEAKNHAGNEPNQSGYNAAWLHGYAAALKDVSEQFVPLHKLQDVHKLTEGLMQIQQNPLYWVAFNMAYISEHCQLNNPLSQEEIYTLAMKLEESYSTLTAGLLHEEHLDAIRFMLEHGLHEDHSPEFSEINADDARVLLMTVDAQVFGTLVETVAINNEVHDVAMNQSIDEEDLATVVQAIEALGERENPEIFQIHISPEPQKHNSLEDKIKDAAFRSSYSQFSSEEKQHQTEVEH